MFNYIFFAKYCNYFSLYCIQLFCRQTAYRAFGNTVFFFHTNKDIASSYIVEIIGKGAYTMIHRYRIPAFLKFDSVGFYFVLVQQIIDINR